MHGCRVSQRSVANALLTWRVAHAGQRLTSPFMSDTIQVLRIVSDYVHLVKFAVPLTRCHSVKWRSSTARRTWRATGLLTLPYDLLTNGLLSRLPQFEHDLLSVKSKATAQLFLLVQTPRIAFSRTRSYLRCGFVLLQQRTGTGSAGDQSGRRRVVLRHVDGRPLRRDGGQRGFRCACCSGRPASHM